MILDKIPFKSDTFDKYFKNEKLEDYNINSVHNR